MEVSQIYFFAWKTPIPLNLSGEYSILNQWEKYFFKNEIYQEVYCMHRVDRHYYTGDRNARRLSSSDNLYAITNE